MYLKLVVVCQQLVDFGDKGGIDVQEGSVEVLVEQMYALVEWLLTFQFGIQELQLSVARQPVQHFRTLLILNN